jgi:hypothetical protein
MKTNRKLEELYSKEICDKVKNVVANVKFIHGKHKVNKHKSNVFVICLIKNGEIYIQNFIEHYKRVGVKHIFFMDNGSTDQTLNIASKYNEVTIFECRLPFNEYKLAMRIFLAETYGSGGWCLSVDIDEFWEFPYCNQISLTQFINYLDEFGFTGCVAHQLDLFGEGVLSKENKNDNLLSDLKYFDLSNVYVWRNSLNNYDKCIDKRLPVFYDGNERSSDIIPVLANGVRWSLFGITPILTKIALFKLVHPVVPFEKSSHRIKGAILADVSCVLLHKLLNNNLFNKAVWCANEGSYFNNSSHYKQIVKKFEDTIPIQLPIYSKLYQHINYLIDLDFIHVSKVYEKFVLGNKEAEVGHDVTNDVYNLSSLQLYIPDAQPRGVIEKHLIGKVEITKKNVHICKSKLDEKGQRRYIECSIENEIETVIGIARLKWKSLQDRSNCIEQQKSKNKGRLPNENRWTEIMSMVSSIKQGNTLPLPTLVHPLLHNYEGLRIIDGARRIIANVEASEQGFPVLIIKPK